MVIKTNSGLLNRSIVQCIDIWRKCRTSGHHAFYQFHRFSSLPGLPKDLHPCHVVSSKLGFDIFGSRQTERKQVGRQRHKLQSANLCHLYPNNFRFSSMFTHSTWIFFSEASGSQAPQGPVCRP